MKYFDILKRVKKRLKILFRQILKLTMYNLRCLSYYQSFIAADHCRIMGNEF